MRSATRPVKASRVKIGNSFLRNGIYWTVMSKRYEKPSYGLHDGGYEFTCATVGARAVPFWFAKTDTIEVESFD